MEDDGSGCSGSDVESSDSTQRFQLITQILHFVSQTRTETKMSNPKIQIYPDLNPSTLVFLFNVPDVC